MQNNPNGQEFNVQEALRLAQTPAGQQLIAMLQSTGGKDFQSAMDNASKGNYTQAKELIKTMLSSPDAQKLLEQLGRK